MDAVLAVAAVDPGAVASHDLVIPVPGVDGEIVAAFTGISPLLAGNRLIGDFDE